MTAVASHSVRRTWQLWRERDRNTTPNRGQVSNSLDTLAEQAAQLGTNIAADHPNPSNVQATLAVLADKVNTAAELAATDPTEAGRAVLDAAAAIQHAADEIRGSA